mmetsp:Transcript_20327/g.58937  ORF Transcript_20327/g.58937 Transcript_20327/m.58937 type:complete len:87 (+) Transcript_20327:620-880(+)
MDRCSLPLTSPGRAPPSWRPSSPSRSKPRAAPQKCNPKIREDIFALHRQRCPEKSKRDIEVIFCELWRKEAEVLDKFRDKYAKAGT